MQTQTRKGTKRSGQRTYIFYTTTLAFWEAYQTFRKQYGPPTLDWFDIQPTLLHAQGDVFLVFDCCYASLATKSRDEGRLELLFAAGASAKTPRPGPFSFTQFFVEEMRKACRERNG